MRFKNNIGPQVRKLRDALGWSQPVLAAKLQIAGWDTTRSAISKIEGRTIYVDDRALVFLAEVLKVEIPDLFPKRDSIFETPLRLISQPAICSFVERITCDHPNWFRSLLIWGPTLFLKLKIPEWLSVALPTWHRFGLDSTWDMAAA